MLLRELGTPWPIRFHFLQLIDTETGAQNLVNVGFEIGEQFEVEPGAESAPLDTEPEPIDLVTVQRIASNYGAYLEFARHALVLEREGMAGAVKLLRGPGRKPARLTDDFYRLIADDYEARRRAGEPHLVKAIAEAHHVDISTASRWIKRARPYMKGADDGE